MGENSRDRIVDACLSEILGGQTPPDLSDRILRNVNQRQGRRDRAEHNRALRIMAALAASVLVATFGLLYARFLQNRGEADKTNDVAELPPQVQPGDAGTPAVVARSSDAEILQAVNASIRRRWEEAGLTPAAIASDTEWCRRVFLDVIGRIPTHQETSDFIANQAADKREALVDRLMASDVYLEEFARNWSNVWTNLLLGRDDDTRGGIVNRQGFQQFVHRAVFENQPYDRFVHELVTATGSNQAGADDYNGAVSFMLQNLSDKAVPATAKTARVFLGVQVQCTQCHNHPFNDSKQSQFWQLNAFFRQAQPKQQADAGVVGGMRLVNETFAGEVSRDPHEAEVYYEASNEAHDGHLKVAFPAFVDGTKIDPSGEITQVDRREELARLIVKSEFFSQAIVNRTWAHFLGYGFTRPIDDMGPHNPPSHADVLERLAREFTAHNYDLRKLYRWIALSEPYSLSSKAGDVAKPVGGKARGGLARGGLAVDDPDSGTAPLFSRFYLRQMRPEELFESLRVMTHAEGTPAEDKAEIERRKAQWMQQFTISYETDELDETTVYQGSVALTLDMWNGELVNRAVSLEKGTLLAEVARDAKIKDKIGYLYLAALGRQPTAAEKSVLTTAWKNHGGNTAAALQDVFWVVLNSNEFVMNR